MLVIVETRPWDAAPQQPEQLKQKINVYAGYVLDGALASQYPETAGQPIRIQLNCPEPPTGEIAAITDWTAQKLSEYGIGFAVHVRN
jgi:hypothetical protein